MKKSTPWILGFICLVIVVLAFGFLRSTASVIPPQIPPPSISPPVIPPPTADLPAACMCTTTRSISFKEQVMNNAYNPDPNFPKNLAEKKCKDFSLPNETCTLTDVQVPPTFWNNKDSSEGYELTGYCSCTSTAQVPKSPDIECSSMNSYVETEEPLTSTKVDCVESLVQ